MAKIDGRQLHIDESVRAATEEHCFSRIDVEVGGFLLGNITESEVKVSASQPAETAQSGQTQLTFTHEAWDEVLSKMETEFAGLEIVGWYHSHPGFGCFLSDYDIFIQENFFSSPGQHALVIDPVSGEEAVLTAKEGTARTITTGKTSTPALGEGLVEQSGNEARATLLEQRLAESESVGQRRTGSVLAKTFGLVALLLLSGGLGWFVGNLQGRDAERVGANAQVADVQSQLADTEAALAATEEELANTVESNATAPEQPIDPEVAPTDTPDATQDVVPSPGARATVDIEYQVRRGDNLWTIAERFIGDGNKFPRLLKWNPPVKETGLIPGETIILRVPATVVSGGE
jgi:proteasome lid subunit RPN8/RPN11